MIVYVSSFVNTNGAGFPNTLAVNASGPSATDGTEFVKLMIDDFWGFNYALLDYAGLTPDGVTEAPGTSQRIEAIQKGFAVGPGMGVTYWKDGDPATNGDRVLLLNGQVVLILNYSDLVDATYVGDGNNGTASAFYKTSDVGGTIRDTAGTYFVLPETRGYALRGLDTAASVDPDGAGRDMGSIQLDALQGHWHNTRAASRSLALTGSGAQIDRVDVADDSDTNTDRAQDASTDGVNGTPRTNSESRMTNVATRWAITY